MYARIVMGEDGTTKFISDVKIGDYVISRSGNKNKVIGKIEHTLSEETDIDLLNIECYYGDDRAVLLSHYHKVLSTDSIDKPLEWMKAEDLTENHYVFVPKPIVPDLISDVPKDIKALQNEDEEFGFVSEIIFKNKSQFVINEYIKAALNKNLYQFMGRLYRTRHYADQFRCLNWILGNPCAIKLVGTDTHQIFSPDEFGHKCVLEVQNGFLLKVKKAEQEIFKYGLFKVYDLIIENESDYLTSSFLVHSSK